MALTVLNGIDEIRDAVGTHLGHSEWLEITHDRVRRFAAATGGRAGIVADDHLVMSLSNHFLPQVVDVRGFALGVNYGCNEIRFTAPVPLGSWIRGGVELTSAEEIPGGVQTVMVITIEVRDGTEPACVLHAVSRYLV